MYLTIDDFIRFRQSVRKQTGVTLYRTSKSELEFDCLEYSFEVPQKLTHDGDVQTGHIIVDDKYVITPGMVRNWSHNGDMINHKNTHKIEVVGTCSYYVFTTKLVVL